MTPIEALREIQGIAQGIAETSPFIMPVRRIADLATAALAAHDKYTEVLDDVLLDVVLRAVCQDCTDPDECPGKLGDDYMCCGAVEDEWVRLTGNDGEGEE